MRSWGVKAILGSIVTLVLSLPAVHAQTHLRGLLATGTGDVAAVKQKAEAGDSKAQISFADTLIGNFRSADALLWYRKAAQQGNLDGAYELGRMLLYGSPGIPKEQAVSPNNAEGIQWTFRAATNRHSQACHNMGKAYQNGWGVATNLITAYAWLKIAAEIPPGSTVARVDLNQLALKLDSNAIAQGTQLAAAFLRGGWQAPSVVVSSDSSDFKLSSISWGKAPLVIINGKTLAVGESANIKLKTRTVAIKCLAIEVASAVIAVEGEDAPRILRLK